ncbi:MAG: pseudaminic acid synthase [Verrucomicrobiales bacterium]|nr:pseudaminic acid synthase [Verrucomicrobiales bacterium]
MDSIKIGKRAVGGAHPTFVIAEISANHNHSYDEAVRLVEAAADCGADAVKIQTYTPDTLTIDCKSEPFQIGKGTIWEGKNLYELYGEAYTPWDWQPKLKQVAEDLGLVLFSTPFDDTAVDFLEEMNVPAHKIASFELVDHGLLSKVAATGKPVIMSTGMASLGEIDESVGVLRDNGCTQLALLKCTSAYPAPAGEANLRTIPHLAEAFGVPAGLSDHTLGIACPVAAVALGACIIEKHVTLSRDVPGPDSSFSLEPAEFKSMVDAIRVAEQALGGVSYELTEKEKSSRVFRRSLFVVEDITEGELLTEANVRSIRPGYGLPPGELPLVLGRKASRTLSRGTPLAWSDCE